MLRQKPKLNSAMSWCKRQITYLMYLQQPWEVPREAAQESSPHEIRKLQEILKIRGKCDKVHAHSYPKLKQVKQWGGNSLEKDLSNYYAYITIAIAITLYESVRSKRLSNGLASDIVKAQLDSIREQQCKRRNQN